MAQYNDENLTSVIKPVKTYSSIMFVTIFYDYITIVIRINRHNLLNIIIVMVLYDNMHSRRHMMYFYNIKDPIFLLPSLVDPYLVHQHLPLPSSHSCTHLHFLGGKGAKAQTPCHFSLHTTAAIVHHLKQRHVRAPFTWDMLIILLMYPVLSSRYYVKNLILKPIQKILK
jgi:hypothetical protein